MNDDGLIKVLLTNMLLPPFIFSLVFVISLETERSVDTSISYDPMVKALSFPFHFLAF